MAKDYVVYDYEGIHQRELERLVGEVNHQLLLHYTKNSSNVPCEISIPRLYESELKEIFKDKWLIIERKISRNKSPDNKLYSFEPAAKIRINVVVS